MFDYINAVWFVGLMSRSSAFSRPLSHRKAAATIKLQLLPLSYWLEYLDLVFFFKRLHGLIDFTLELSYYFSLLKDNTRRASSGLHLKLNACCTSSFRDFYFNRITLMWNSLPKNIKDSDTQALLKVNSSRFILLDF